MEMECKIIIEYSDGHNRWYRETLIKYNGKKFKVKFAYIKGVYSGFDAAHYLAVLSPSTLTWERVADIDSICPEMRRGINSWPLEGKADKFTEECKRYIEMVYSD